MAAPILCDNADGNLADLMVTNVHNGDTFALCGVCIPLWADALRSEFTRPELVAEPEPASEPQPEAPGDAAASPAFRVVADETPEATAPERSDDPGPPPPESDAPPDQR